MNGSFEQKKSDVRSLVELYCFEGSLQVHSGARSKLLHLSDEKKIPMYASSFENVRCSLALLFLHSCVDAAMYVWRYFVSRAAGVASDQRVSPADS